MSDGGHHMRVDAYDCASHECVAENATLALLFPSDVDGREAAKRELTATGRTKVGGGAAPLFLLVVAGTSGCVGNPDDDEPGDRCTSPFGHEWAFTGSAYGGDDDSYHGEGRCYCVNCGADGDA